MASSHFRWDPRPGRTGRFERLGGSSAIPWWVLAAGLLLTGVLIGLAWGVQEQQRLQRQQNLASEVAVSLDRKLGGVTAILSATAGLFHASDWVGGEEFRRFYRSLQISRESLQGVQGVGDAQWIPPVICRPSSPASAPMACRISGCSRPMAACPTRRSFTSSPSTGATGGPSVSTCSRSPSAAAPWSWRSGTAGRA